MKTSFVRYIVMSMSILVMMVLFSACSGLGNNGQTTVTGSIVSASNGTVVVNVNGQQETINNVPASVIQSLQNQVGRTYTIQVTSNNGSFSIVGGSNPVLDNEGTPNTNETPNTNNETPTANEPGSMQFYGAVQSVGNNSLVVTMPAGGTLSFITNASTDLKDWNNALPSVGTQVKVEVTANTDGSFTANKIGNVDSSNNTTQAQFTGVTTAAVGSDHVLHFAVGNRSFNFSIASNADLGDFNGNVQSIQNGANIKVTVQFNGSTGSVIQVGNNSSNQ
ncbi:MAG: DUF5666 domain-containing protein [Ktedonobacteraceae bacterium]